MRGSLLTGARLSGDREFLRIPPFPGASVGPLVRTGGPDALCDEQVDELAEQLRQSRVGGSYWGAQPALPAGPYTLVRLEGDQGAGRLAEQLTGDILYWSDGAIPHASTAADVVTGEVDPWHLLSGATAVVCGSADELGFIAGLLGLPVGRAGEDGGCSEVRPLGTGELRDIMRNRLLDARKFFDPFSGDPASVSSIVAVCAAWRQLVDRNRDLAGAFGFAAWKRKTTHALLWGGSGAVAFDPPLHLVDGGSTAAVWLARVAPAIIDELRQRGVKLLDVEDGFIRSAGLGADCVPPLSIVVDRGAHFDAREESELERLLQHGEFDAALLARADALRREIVRRGLSKYDVGEVALERRGAQRHILVPGQVEDDRAVLATPGGPLSNLALLQQVRAAAPDAFVIYKPHPDVEAGHRKGAVADVEALKLADEIVRDQNITSLIAMVDEVHVNSSLAGFEALLREKAVTTYGVPFYAGWGLTIDRGLVPQRRTARRTLSELVAAALLLYPRYLDPVTGLPCSAEVVIQRLSEPGLKNGQGSLVSLRRFQGRLKKALTSLRPSGR